MSLLTPAAVEFIPADYFSELPPGALFPDASRPLELDVGCGDGTFLLQMAAHYPDRDFLGIERLSGRIRKICRRAVHEGLTNVRVIHLESAYTLAWLLPAGCASRLHLLFPDPWPKKRHAFHRFVAPENLAGIHRALAPSGQFLFKTDHEDYYTEATEIVDASPLFTRLPWPGPDEFYPVTDFEQQWIDAGKKIQGARWQRRDPAIR
jgi:tRNA (guanine-N7-)-methyltransferase